MGGWAEKTDTKEGRIGGWAETAVRQSANPVCPPIRFFRLSAYPPILVREQLGVKGKLLAEF